MKVLFRTAFLWVLVLVLLGGTFERASCNNEAEVGRADPADSLEDKSQKKRSILVDDLLWDDPLVGFKTPPHGSITTEKLTENRAYALQDKDCTLACKEDYDALKKMLQELQTIFEQYLEPVFARASIIFDAMEEGLFEYVGDVERGDDQDPKQLVLEILRTARGRLKQNEEK